MSEHKSWCALYQSDPAAGKNCDCGAAEDAANEARAVDQLAWDRFAAAALNVDIARGYNDAQAATMAAAYADAMMLERAKRVRP